MQQRLFIILLGLIMSLPVSAGTTRFHRLSKLELQNILVGHSVTDEAHWADTFLPEGQLAGHQLGNSQHGSWHINWDGDLCVTRIVRQSESDCFQVWLRDDQVEYRQGKIVLTEGVLRPE